MTEQARRSNDFVNSIGLNVHFGYYGTPYTLQQSRLLIFLTQLGVLHLRDQMSWEGSVASASAFYAVHNTLGLMGMKTDYILTSLDYPMGQVQLYPLLVNDIEAVEASNEWDASGDANWAAEIRTQQAALYKQINSSDLTKGITVVSPSLAWPQSGAALGDTSSISDVGESHAYYGGWNPGNSGAGGANNPAYFMNWARVNNPSQPIWVTETGFWSVPGSYFGGSGISQQAMAIYTPRNLFEFWNAGAARTYVYELMDWNGSTNFGLIQSNGATKPAFYSILNLINLLRNTGSGDTFTPGSLTYSLQGAGSTVHHTLLQKSDKSFYLAIWNEALSYDFTNQAAMTIPPQNVTLQLAGTPSVVQATQWDQSGNVATTVFSPSQSIPLTVTDKLQVVKIMLK